MGDDTKSELRKIFGSFDVSGLFNKVLPTVAQFVLERIDPDIHDMTSNQKRIDHITNVFADWADDKTDLPFWAEAADGPIYAAIGKAVFGMLVNMAYPEK